MSSPIIKHFLVSLFAVVHAAEYAPISWHRAQGAFIPKGAAAERCIMDVPSGKIVVQRLVGQEDQRKSKEPDPIETNVSWAPRANGCLEAKTGGSVQHRCQWSAAKAGVSSVSRLHHATNVYLSMKHDVAKQAANEMALKKKGGQVFLRSAHLLGGSDHFRRRGRH